MDFRRILTSPLGVLGLSMIALALWTSAYRAQPGSPGALAREALLPRAEAQDLPSPAALRPPSALPPIPAVRPAPRLRTPYGDGSQVGLDVAIQDRDGHSMDALHAALRRAATGQGKARLLFWGASHTACDLYTGHLRSALQQSFGDAGHGFVLPVAPWRGYRHQGVSIGGTPSDWSALKVAGPTLTPDHYGIAGVAVESATPGATALVATTAEGAVGHAVSSFDLYYLEQPSGGAFDVLVDGEPIDRIRTAAEARRGAYRTFQVPDGGHRLEVRVLGTGPVRIFGVSLERDASGVVVDTLGINGARARNQLYWDDELYREQLRRRAPDLVVLAYGTNEAGDDNQPIASYYEQLTSVVRRIRETVPQASCLLVGPSDRPVAAGRNEYVDRPRTAAVNDVQWRVALEQGCGFFDVVAFQGGPMSTVEWAAMNPPMMGRDRIHFTRLGYERLGQVLLGALLEGSGYEPPGATPGSEMAAAR